MAVAFAQDAGRMGGLRRGGAEAEGGDLPEDMQIGFSGKGGGAFGSFATPARSSRPTSQVGHATSSSSLSLRANFKTEMSTSKTK